MSSIKVGFEYHFEAWLHDVLVDEWDEHNLVPLEGLVHILGVTLKGVTQVTQWYLLIYEGNYVPISGDTGATFPGSATESTAYAESTRQAFVTGSTAGGTCDNTASPAQFTMNADKTIYGGAIVSAAAKGNTTDVLLSAVKFSTPKVLSNGTVLKVTAGLTATSS